MPKERNNGIDLLRLVFAGMVCVLHVLGWGGVLDGYEKGTAGYRVFWLMEILCFCAVDGFGLITGYMSSGKPRKTGRFVEMWFQAVFYSFVVTAFFFLIGVKKSWGALEILSDLMPVTFDKFFYFTGYFLVFLVSPLLDRALFAVDEKLAKKTLVVLALAFTVLGLVDDCFWADYGYAPIWLVVLYCIGVLAKRVHLFEGRKTSSLVAIWGGCMLLTWIVHGLGGVGRLTNYCSPTILLSAMVLVVLFSRLRVRGKWIAVLSPLVFGMYLFQLNDVVWNELLLNRFLFVAEKPLLPAVLWVMGLCAVTFAVSMVVEFARSRGAKMLRIPALSSFLGAKLDAFVDQAADWVK